APQAGPAAVAVRRGAGTAVAVRRAGRRSPRAGRDLPRRCAAALAQRHGGAAPGCLLRIRDPGRLPVRRGAGGRTAAAGPAVAATLARGGVPGRGLWRLGAAEHRSQADLPAAAARAVGIDRAGEHLQLPQRPRHGFDDPGRGAGAAGVAYALALAGAGRGGRVHRACGRVPAVPGRALSLGRAGRLGRRPGLGGRHLPGAVPRAPALAGRYRALTTGRDQSAASICGQGAGNASRWATRLRAMAAWSAAEGCQWQACRSRPDTGRKLTAESPSPRSVSTTLRACAWISPSAMSVAHTTTCA